MIRKNIKGLRNVTLNTRLEVKGLLIGEVAEVKFQDIKQFNALLATKTFEEVPKILPTKKSFVVKVIEAPVPKVDADNREDANGDADVEVNETVDDSDNPSPDDDATASPVDESPTLYVCPVCKTEYKTELGLEKHLAKVHPEVAIDAPVVIDEGDQNVGSEVEVQSTVTEAEVAVGNCEKCNAELLDGVCPICG